MVTTAEHQRLWFALVLWNEHDPILKERLFGLANAEDAPKRWGRRRRRPD